MKHWLVSVLVAISLVALFAPVEPSVFAASTADELKLKIDEQTAKVKALEAEIAKYEADLADISKNKSTLKSEIKRLDTLRKKFATDIAVTQSKVASANLLINQLNSQIDVSVSGINANTTALKQSLQAIAEDTDATYVEILFSPGGFDALWQDIDQSTTVNRKLQGEISKLQSLKVELSEHRTKTSEEKSKLAALQKNLAGQKSILDQNRSAQTTLLTQTQNKESAFQKLLEEKRLAKQQFEAEITKFESELKYVFDPTLIPTAGSGVLKFPFSETFMQRCKSRQSAFKNLYCITQYFGDTAFARSGAYNGKGHNGVDFGSPEGTEVRAALSGTVTATGNTDAYRGCYSYGKWVLITHDNGLATLYSHLSYIGVKTGQSVDTGTMIGYSGSTGYATGPHLHFTLYVASTVKLVKMGDVKAKTNCAGATVPIAPTNAYLNPIEYL